ncbi:MAG: primosomal protein N' [Sedimentisphaerales bacterium]|nr:primosomal protein N' [Sedimentisphaerales bacterium]
MTKHDTAGLFDTSQPQPPASHVIGVAFEAGVDSQFDYLVPDKLWPVQPGQRVEAPFGRSNKLAIGFCVETDISRTDFGKKFKLKTISDVIDKVPLLDAGLMELAEWLSDYYVCPLGVVLAAMVPGAVKKGAGEKKEKYVYLASGPEKIDKVETEIKGKKQKLLIGRLKESGAYEPETAVEFSELLADVGCTDIPLKNLADKAVIKIVQRTVLRSLPAIPESMLIRQEKVILNNDQQKALSTITSRLNTGRFAVTLLYGVTDSGKTELYIRAIDEVIKKGKSAIVLLPEIALTTQTIQRFSARFERIAVMHSGLTAPQRNSQWQKIKSGEANVVIGARSAVFAPLNNLGLIIVDEEHEPSYKQDTAPRYHGRDVAIKRAQLCNAHCILGSSTPSLETLQNCLTKKTIFNMVRLPKRVMNLPFPEMRLIDMKDFASGKDGITLLSEPLANHLSDVLARNEQAILLLNRRGYSNFIFCPSCKHIIHCRNCDATLTFHKLVRRGGMPGRQTAQIPTITGRHLSTGYAICHYCGSQTLVPEKCPLCGKSMIMLGLGSQRLEEELAGKFPQAKVARVDSDSMKGADYYRVLRDFSEGRINVLAGTQMLAKGLHFPNVTLVGIISADTSLYLPDFRANERTFQLISQVAGRAGRSAKKGVVFVQTFLAGQPAIQFALKGDFDGFVKEELKHRAICNLPPFWRLALITLRDRTYEKLELAAKAMRENIDQIVYDENLQVKVRGPIPATISRIQTFHRLQIILQAPSPTILHRLFVTLRKSPPVRPAVTIAVDVDPVDLL